MSQRARRDAVLEGIGDTGRLGRADRHAEAPAVALAPQDHRGLKALGIDEEPDHARLLRPGRRRRLGGKVRGRGDEGAGNEERQSDVRHQCVLGHLDPPPGRPGPARASSIGPSSSQVKPRGAS